METPGRKCGRSRSPRLHHLLRRPRQRAPCNHLVVPRPPRRLKPVPRRPPPPWAVRPRRALNPVVELAVGVAAVGAQAAGLAAVALPVEGAAVARRHRNEA